MLSEYIESLSLGKGIKSASVAAPCGFGHPVVLRLRFEHDGYKFRDGLPRGAEATYMGGSSDFYTRLPIESDPALIESEIEKAAWRHGASDISRIAQPPRAWSGDFTKDCISSGLGLFFGKEIYKIPGDQSIGQQDDIDLIKSACTLGYWLWSLKIPAGMPALYHKKWRAEDSTLNAEMRRDGEFSWVKDKYYDLLKSFEQASISEPDLCLRLISEFRGNKLRVNPRA